MRSFILSILLSASVSAQCIQGVDCPAEPNSQQLLDLLCSPKIFAGYDSIGAIQCGRFDSHVEAEQHYYHCQEGIAIMGAAIIQLDPKFIPVLSVDDFIARVKPSCSGFEIYPDSHICNLFSSHREAEANYSACRTTNFQYWDYLQELQASQVPACQDGGDFFDGAYQGALWKPQADPKARCKNGTTILLPSSYASSVSSGEILDVNYNKLNDVEYFGLTGGRPRFCLRKAGAEFGEVSLVFRYKVNGVDECRIVQNASKRED